MGRNQHKPNSARLPAKKKNQMLSKAGEEPIPTLERQVEAARRLVQELVLLELQLRRRSWPALWDLFSFILPGDVQEKVYGPAKVHLLKDYVRRLEYSGKWAQRWIHFAFFVRTLLLVLDCLRAMITYRACTFFKELFLGK